MPYAPKWEQQEKEKEKEKVCCYNNLINKKWLIKQSEKYKRDVHWNSDNMVGINNKVM
jgi:hypothetical protein